MVLQTHKIRRDSSSLPTDNNLTFRQDLISSRLLSRMGLQGLASSKLWIDFIQYYGGQQGEDSGFKYSYDYLQSISEIEPRFINPYLVVVSALGFRSGNPEPGQEILMRGLDYITPDWNEDSYRLPFQLAILNFLFLGDQEGGRDAYYLAAERYERSHGESAEQWRELGDSLYQNPRSARSQFNIWHQIYTTSMDEEVKGQAYERLLELGNLETMPDGSKRLIPPPI